MVGADLARMREAAAELNRGAAELDDAAAELSGLLGSFAWLGQAAVAFTDLFMSVRRPQLTTSAEYLRSAARRLQQEADQQEQASRPGGSGGSAGGGSAGGGVRPGAMDYLKGGLGAVPGLLAVLGLGQFAGIRHAATGRLSQAWQRAVDKTDDLLRAKNSPMLRVLSTSKTLAWLDKAARVPVIRQAAPIIGWGTVAVDVGQGIYALNQGRTSEGRDQLIDAAQGALKTIPTPATYLAGVATSVAEELGTAIGEAVEGQRGTGTWLPPNPLDNGNWRAYWEGGVIGTAKELPGMAVRII